MTRFAAGIVHVREGCLGMEIASRSRIPLSSLSLPRTLMMLTSIGSSLAVLTTLTILSPSTMPEDPEPRVACQCCEASVSKLRLYVDASLVKPAQNGFVPQIARVFVDDAYMGDAILNLNGYLPTLNFSRGKYRIRIELPEGKKIEREVMFLGNGSTQVLALRMK